MAHEVETAMYAINPAWHGIGTVLDHVPTAAEAIDAAGLSWEVCKRTLGAVDSTGRYPSPFEPSNVSDWKATVRESDGRVLGVVGADFSVLQNRQVSELLDESLARAGQAVQYEAAGSLRGGRQVWFLARLPRDLVIGQGAGDVQRLYALVLNGHDGSRALTFLATAIRAVCMNTIQAALSEGGSQCRFLHSGGLEGRVKQVVAAWRGVLEGFEVFEERAQKMAAAEIPAADFSKVIELTVRTVIDGKSETAERRRVQALGRILAHFGNTPTNPGEERSAWRAYNAVSEWLDHEAVSYRTKETRFESLMFGEAAILKRRAFSALHKAIAA